MRSNYTVPESGFRFVLDIVPFSADVSFDSILKHMFQMAEELCSRGNYCYVVMPSEIAGKRNEAVLPESMRKRATVLYSAPMTSGLLYRGFISDMVLYANKFGYHHKSQYTADFALGLLGPSIPNVAATLALGYEYPAVPFLMFEPAAELVTEGVPDWHSHLRTNFLPFLHSSARGLYLTEYESEQNTGFAAQSGFSASQIGQIKERSIAVGIPWGPAFLKMHGNHLPKFEKKTLFCGGRMFDGDKNIDKITAVFSSLAAELKCDAVLSTPNAVRTVDSAKMALPTNIKLVAGCGRDQYLELCAKSHVFLNWSVSESYGMAIREAAALGCVLLTVDTPENRATFRGLFTEDMLFDDTVEAGMAAAKHALLNYDALYAAQAPMRERILAVGLKSSDLIAETARNAIIQRYDDLQDARNREDERMLFGSVSLDHWRNRNGKLPEQLYTFINSKVGQSFTIWEVIQSFASVFDGNADTYLYSCRKFGLPTWPQLRNLLTHVYGLKDQCTGRFPTFLPEKPIAW